MLQIACSESEGWNLVCCLSWQIVDTSCWNLHWAAVAVSEAHGTTDNEITYWWPAMTMPVSVQWISWQSHPCLSAPRIFARTLRSLGVCSGCLCSVCQKSSLQRRHFLQRRWAFINLGAGCLCSMPCVLWLMQICRTISHGYHQLSEAHLSGNDLLALPLIPIDIYHELASMFGSVNRLNEQGMSDEKATCHKFGQDAL